MTPASTAPGTDRPGPGDPDQPGPDQHDPDQHGLGHASPGQAQPGSAGQDLAGPGPGGPAAVVIALGSNLGDRLAHLQAAVDTLAAAPGISVTAVSPVYQTDPVGGPDQPDYYNAVLLARTTLPPAGVLAAAHAAEAAEQRTRTIRWGPRTLDVDIISYGGVTSTDPELTLPHPRAHERAFVLVPWHDVDPAAELPGHGPVADLIAGLTGPAGLAGDGLRRAGAGLRRPS
ncbi:MAG TPA: 2-amino-4-hydroxy-6-hydroxymethyldihydropteridine diphosphokinase [Streptosporangiaceae bacterium]|nr:2-amino-4-hydroxy-6-hydroxymethyldihydropteridine diphosphokinase [Streptosporangiaceae bacterium]